MSVERSLYRTMPFMPRHRSVSATSSLLGFPTSRSRSQPSMRVAYYEGSVTKFISHSRPAHSPSPHRVIMLCAGNKKTKSPLVRTTRSNSYSDLCSSHVFSVLKCATDKVNHQESEVDARATSVGDIYHKGPFYPDRTQSESGVSLNDTEDCSLFDTVDDDIASQRSYGSSSAFHEITNDSEFDRLDSEDGLRSPREPTSWSRLRDVASPESNRSSPYPYADAMKRELMSSPSWEFDKTQSRQYALRALTPDGSQAKDRQARKDSIGSTSTPLAQSTPHVSPRSFMGPKLSIKGSWNVDEPCDEADAVGEAHAMKKAEDSSCFSSYSEDNLSDSGSPSKKSSRKVKLTKKASDPPIKRTKPSQVAQREQNVHDRTLVSEESLDNIFIPPLESVIGEEEAENARLTSDKDTGSSWWEVFNIGSANARREEEANQSSSENRLKQEVTIVKPGKTGIPLLSAGKHGKEKLKRNSQSSPTSDKGTFSPKSTSPSLTDRSFESVDGIIFEQCKGPETEPLVKRECKEHAEAVLRKATQSNLNISDTGAFNVVRSSGHETDGGETSSTLSFENNIGTLTETTNYDVFNMGDVEHSKDSFGDQWTQPVEENLITSSIAASRSLPLHHAKLVYLSSTSKEEGDRQTKQTKQQHPVIDNSLECSLPLIEPQQMTLAESSVTSGNNAYIIEPSLHRPINQSCELARGTEPLVIVDDVDKKVDEREKETNRSYRYVLDNSTLKDGQTSTVLSAPHVLGDESPQVLESSKAKVGGSTCGEVSQGLRETSEVTSHTPEIGTDNHPSEPFSVEEIGHNTDGLLYGEKDSGNSKDSQGNEFDELCSDFASALNISDPNNKTLVEEEEDDEQLHASIYVSSEQEKEQEGDRDRFHESVNSNDVLKFDHQSLLASSIVEENTIDDGGFEILSGNVELDKSSKHNHPSNQSANAESSFDPDHREEADSTMEWRFIDSRLVHATSKSLKDGIGGDAVEINGEKSPLVVRVIATAELPRTSCTDDETRDGNQRCQDPDQEFRLPQDDDSFIPTANSRHQQFNNDEYHLHDIQSRSYENETQPVSVNSILNKNTRTVDNFEIEQRRENYSPDNVQNIDNEGSIEYPAVEANSRGDKGISRFEETNAQNSEDDERLSARELLSSPSPSGPTLENRAGTEGASLSQQVKRIHRKTVEETVTIERSRINNESVPATSRHFEECDNREQFVTSRKEVTVIHEEDQVFTTTTGPGVFVFPSVDVKENVSSGDLAYGINRENPVADNLPTNSIPFTLIQEEPTDSETPPPLPSTPPPELPSDSDISPPPLPSTPPPELLFYSEIPPPLPSTPPPELATHSDIPPPLPSTPPPALRSTSPEPIIIVDTPASISTYPLPTYNTCASSHDFKSPESQTSAMKWFDRQASVSPTQYASVNPSNNLNINSKDTAMVIGADQDMNVSGPVMHQSPLDDLHAQLTQISENDGISDSAIPSPYVYHDQGAATTIHVLTNGGEVTSENVNNSKNSNVGLDLDTPLTCGTSDSEKSSHEIYDNDYDYINDDQSNGTIHQSRQHHLLKSGQNKASSLWTLNEETESLLEDVSPITSPKRTYTTAVVDERDEEVFVSRSNTLNEGEPRNESVKSNSLLRPFPYSTGLKKYISDSSDVDESDGNYSSISTTDNSSNLSSRCGRGQTPLSDSDTGIPGDTYIGKMNNHGHSSQSAEQKIDGISSFNEFVTGLEDEQVTSDWTKRSLASPQNIEIEHAHVDNEDLPEASPQTFKSSVAFCISAAAPQTLVPCHERELIQESYIQPRFQTPSNNPQSAISPEAKRKTSFSPRLAGLQPFPVDEDFMNVSSTSSTHGFTDDTHSEASSRLCALDIDLSRISTCASPTPSDFSDRSSTVFTSKGTAEIKRGHSVSFEDDYDMLPLSNNLLSTSTPRPLKSVLKKSTKGELTPQHQSRDSYHATWVNQFDRILEDFNNKTSTLGPGSEVVVLEDTRPRVGSMSSQGSNFTDLYKAFTNDDSEKKQNHICPVVEDENMSTFKFKRFLKKSHTKRSKGKRLVRFLSRLNCVSESVHSPDMSATRKRAKLDNGLAYGTDFMPPPSDRVHQPTASSALPTHHQSLTHSKDSPTSSNHSLDSCPSRTDSAYSSISESLAGVLNSPKESRYSSRLPGVSISSASNDTHQPDTPDGFSMDSVHSSLSDYSSLRAASETTDPFSPRPEPRRHSKDMMTTLSDVFDELDVCEGEIDTALLERLRSGHHAVHFNK